jgi:hypothetical protein
MDTTMQIRLQVALFRVRSEVIQAASQGNSESFTLKMEATCSSETLVLTTITRRHYISEENILNYYRREDMRSYKLIFAERWRNVKKV